MAAGGDAAIGSVETHSDYWVSFPEDLPKCRNDELQEEIFPADQKWRFLSWRY